MDTQDFQQLVLQKFDGLDSRFDTLEGRFDGLEGRFDSLETRSNVLETKLDRLTEDFHEFREESRSEHASTRTLISQAFEHLAGMMSHEVRIRTIEERVFGKEVAKA